VVSVFTAGKNIEIKVRDMELSDYKHRRRTVYEREQLYHKVQKLLEKGFNGKQISKEIGVPMSTTGKYINTVTTRQKRKWQEESNITLEDRVLEIKNYYERLAEVAEEIMNDPQKSSKDRMDAGKLLLACKNNVYNMMSSGSLKVRTTLNSKDIDVFKIAACSQESETSKKKKDVGSINE
jgi:hypothetical protein